jgi:hypothetical protein
VIRVKGGFHSSRGWLERLEKWISMHNVKTTGELLSSDCVAGAKYPKNFKKIMD